MVTRREAIRQLSATLLALPLLAGASRGLVATSARAAAPPEAPGLLDYRIEATLDVEGGRLAARQVVRFRNAIGRPLESVVFHAVPGSYGGLGLEASAVDGQAREASLHGSVLEIPFEAPLEAGASAEIELRYAIRLPREPGRISATPRAVALGNWFPILAVHRGDWDRRQYVDVGDAFYTEVADYDVTMTVSRPIQVTASGRLVERDPTGTRWRWEAAGVRDFAIVGGGFAVRSAAAGATIVEGYASTPETAQLYAERGADFVRWFGDRLGAYPYPTLVIVDADLPASYGGMEYPGLVMLSAQSSGPAFGPGSGRDVLLAHEIAHQWFYSLVGNDQIADPWLDEAFATYLPVLYFADARPDLYPGILEQSVLGGAAQLEARAGGGPVDSSINDFPDDGPYFGIVYRKGARFLHALRGELGDAVFSRLVRDHIATYRDRLATPRAFLDHAQSATSTNLNPLIAQFFSYAAFRYPSSQAWTVQAPTTPWQGSADLFVGAEFPVTRVQIWLDGRLLADGPGNALTVDLSGVEAGEYVLLARVWNHDGALFERGRRVVLGG